MNTLKKIVQVVFLAFSMSQYFSPGGALAKTNSKEVRTLRSATYLEANCLEAVCGLQFQQDKNKYEFRFKVYEDKKLPYALIDNESLTNEEFVGTKFQIEYITLNEQAEENEGWIQVNVIKSIKIIK